MKTYQVIKVSSILSASKTQEKVEKILNEKGREGFDIVSVSFLYSGNIAYITICK